MHSPDQISPPTRRLQGMTLLEVTIALTVAFVLFGAVGSAFSALTRGTGEFTSALVAHAQNQRARRTLTEDIQMADTINKDEYGKPYFEIVDHGSGTANSVIIRRIEGFASPEGEDRVEMVYGEPIQYFVDADGELTRRQGGEDVIVAENFESIQFESSASGVVLVRLTAYSGSGERKVTEEIQLRIAPRNILSM